MKRLLLALAVAFAASPAFALQPTGVAACNLWVRTDVNNGYSDLGSTPVTNGGAIEQYDDACASANNLKQTTSGDRPLWEASVWNGHGGILFNGSSDFLQDANASASVEPGTWIVLYIMTAGCPYGSSTGEAIASANTSGSSYAGFDLLACSNYNSTLEQGRDYGRTTSGGTDQTWMTDAQEFTNLPVIMAIRNTGSSLIMYTEGTQIRTASIGGNTATTLNGTNTIFGAGQYGGSNNQFFSGYVLEIQRYTADIGDTDVQQLVGDIKNRYGLGHTNGNFIGAFSEGAATETAPYYLDLGVYLADTTYGINDYSWHLSDFIPGGTCSTPVGRPSVAQFAIGQDTWLAYSGILTPLTSFTIAGSSDSVQSPVIRFTCGQVISMSAEASGANPAVYHPRWFVDGDNSIHIVVMAGGNISPGSPSGSSAIYELHPLNGSSNPCKIADNCNMSTATWSTPVALTGSGFSAAEADPKLTLTGGTYCLTTTNEASGLPGQEVPYAYTSSSPFTGYGAGTQLATPFGYSSGNAYARVFSVTVNGAEQIYEQWSQGSSEVEQYYAARAASGCTSTLGSFVAIDNIFLSPGHLQAGDVNPSPFPPAGKMMFGPFGFHLPANDNRRLASIKRAIGTP